MPHLYPRHAPVRLRKRKPSSPVSPQIQRTFAHRLVRVIIATPALAPLVLAQPSQASGVTPAYKIESVQADGKVIKSNPDTKRIGIPHGVKDLVFALKPSRDDVQPPRFRFQLEGYDAGWREPGGSMRFTVRFDEPDGNTIFGEEFQADRESPGWNGNPATSPGIERSETIRIPPGAARMQFWMGSAGPHATLGIYAVGDLSVQLIPKDAQPSVARHSIIPNEGALMAAPNGTPLGWARHGSRLGIATIAPRNGMSPLVVMHDDRADAFGGWLTTSASVDVSHAKEAVLSWNERYSIGWGGPAKATYSYVPPGLYTLRIQTASIDGIPNGESDLARIEIIPPFHQSHLFRIGTAAAALLAVAATIRSVTRARMQRKLDLLEKAHAIDIERSRIARDLHDNLGADLTHLGLLCDLASSHTSDNERLTNHLNELFELARQLTRRVDEMVWTVNPTQDTLKGLTAFMTHQAQTYLRAAGIACRLELPDPIPDIALSSTQRHHLFLTVKEALHNVVKHAHASEVRLRLRLSPSRLEIEIEDNGQGITTTTEGHGSGNMRSRMAAIGGNLNRFSEASRGTIVSVTLPTTPNQPG